jgi:hypothetical protein
LKKQNIYQNRIDNLEFKYHLNHLKVYYCHKVSQTLKSHTRLQCFKINLGVMIAIVSSRFNLGVMVIIV